MADEQKGAPAQCDAAQPIGWRWRPLGGRWQYSGSDADFPDGAGELQPLYAGSRTPAEGEEPKTLWGMIAAVYGQLDPEDCAFVDREWAKMRGYIIPEGGASTLRTTNPTYQETLHKVAQAREENLAKAIAERDQLRAQVEDEKWQPIGTAPKDGTPLDLWIKGRVADAYWGRPEHSCGEAGSYCDCCPSYDGWCDVFGYLTGPDGSSNSEPTHWRRIPPGPSHSSTEQEPVPSRVDREGGWNVARGIGGELGKQQSGTPSPIDGKR